MKPLNETIKNLNTILKRIEEQIIISKKPVDTITYKLCDYKVGSILPSTEDFCSIRKGDDMGI